MNEADSTIYELKRKLEFLEKENYKMREDMKYMNEDYNRQLDKREDEIQNLSNKLKLDKPSEM